MANRKVYHHIPVNTGLYSREEGVNRIYGYDYVRMTIRGDTDTGISHYHLTMLRNDWVDTYLHQPGDVFHEMAIPPAGQDPIACIITDVVATNGGQVYEIDAVSVASVLQRTQSQLRLTNTTSSAIVAALAAEAGYHYHHYSGVERNYAEWDSRGISVWDAVRKFCDGENCYAKVYNNNFDDPTTVYSPPRHSLVIRTVPTTPSAVLTTGQEIIAEPEWSEDEKNLVNDLILQCNGFTRSFADAAVYRDTASAAKYGICSRRVSRMDIDNVADADAYAAGYIAKMSRPKTICKATITPHEYVYTTLNIDYVEVRPHAIGELYTIVDEINGRTQDLLLRSYNYDSSKDAYEAVFSEPNLDPQSYFNDQAARINDLENQVGGIVSTPTRALLSNVTVDADLNMAGRNITAVGTVDGVNVSTHTHDGTAVGGQRIKLSGLVIDADKDMGGKSLTNVNNISGKIIFTDISQGPPYYSSLIRGFRTSAGSMRFGMALENQESADPAGYGGTNLGIYRYDNSGGNAKPILTFNRNGLITVSDPINVTNITASGAITQNNGMPVAGCPVPFKKSVSFDLAHPEGYLDVLDIIPSNRRGLKIDLIRHSNVNNIVEGTGPLVKICLIYDDDTVSQGIYLIRKNGSSELAPPDYYALPWETSTKNYIKGIRIIRTPESGANITGSIDIIGQIY